jgi:protein-disulfide isomerase
MATIQANRRWLFVAASIILSGAAGAAFTGGVFARRDSDRPRASAARSETSKTPSPGLVLAQASPRLRVSTRGAPFKGNPNAGVVIVEFSDFECGFCRRHARDTLPQIEAGYVHPGKVRYVFRHFPRPNKPSAATTHQAAECAAVRGAFWAVHDALFKRRGQGDDVAAIAGRAGGVAVDQVRACASAQRYRLKVESDVSEGLRLDLEGTPAFVIGRSGPDGSDVIVKKVITGAKGFWVFQRVLNDLLDGSRPR